MNFSMSPRVASRRRETDRFFEGKGKAKKKTRDPIRWRLSFPPFFFFYLFPSRFYILALDVCDLSETERPSLISIFGEYIRRGSIENAFPGAVRAAAQKSGQVPPKGGRVIKLRVTPCDTGARENFLDATPRNEAER